MDGRFLVPPDRELARDVPRLVIRVTGRDGLLVRRDSVGLSCPSVSGFNAEARLTRARAFDSPRGVETTC